MEHISWVTKYPEVEKVCNLFGLYPLQNPLKYSYTSIPGYIQEGPQCGLVALAMISQYPTKDIIDDLVKEAKILNYTYNGEMFSVKDMCHLAQTALCQRRIEIYNGDINNSFVKEFLLNNGLMLVPYDSDRNHSPCEKKGHSAHWAAITGAVETQDGEFYVLARHGKSKNVAVWKLEDLALSNSQLKEFSPDRKIDTLNYKLPVGGLSGPSGLQSQCVLIYGNKDCDNIINLA